MAKTEADSGHTYKQWIAAISANFITLSFGFESGWISPVTTLLQSNESPAGEPLSDNEVAWIACVLVFTATIGVPLFGYIGDKYGSKHAVILVNIPLALSWLVRILCSSTIYLIIARAICGFAAGGVFTVIPMYVKEISQNDMRGVFGSLLILFQNIGTFIMFIIGAYVDYYTVLYISLAYTIVTGLLMIRAPQSPLFLLKHNKTEEAVEVIAYLRGLDKEHKTVQAELEYMKNEEARFRALSDISIKSIVNEPSTRRGLILILCIFSFRSYGAFIMITYASAILTSTGVKFDISPDLQSLSLPSVMILASFLLTAIIERCGRKILLVSSFVLTFVSMITLGGAILAQRMGLTVPSWLPVCAMMLAVFVYAGGVSPLPFIILTEMFSYQIRAKVMSGVVAYTWFISFVAISLYTPMSLSLGEHTTWIIFGIINLLGAIFVLLFLPETKAKNDEEIRQMLSKGKVKQEVAEFNQNNTQPQNNTQAVEGIN